MRRIGYLVAAAIAAATLPLSAGPAAAASSAEVNCSTSGGSGTGKWTWSSKYKLSNVRLTARDLAADGRHVAIRLVTLKSNDTMHYWPYHHMYGGNGNQDTWTSSANDTAGIKRANIELAIFNGKTLIRECGGASKANPYW
ncbi:hypothetical protein C3486_06600 [Streptomyces sp. Ru73]|uniref:hypothetical protein n=1 Tax=Streptomyces sp. Ru73 TaxID=2080748 RepID=UPI000CDD3BA9|nr:hypothetical protein [Streptomyces sp. Ru73]POX42138.1 hypothetical protein C3486_06600 [Streptomyces sp. Ru73]